MRSTSFCTLTVMMVTAATVGTLITIAPAPSPHFGRGSAMGAPFRSHSVRADASRSSTPGSFVVAQPAALPHDAHELGPLPRAHELQLTFALTPKDALALARTAREISTPGTPIFHRYLSPPEIARRFGPTPATISRIAREIQALGLKLGTVSANHLMIHASASAGTLATSLRAHLDAIRFATGGLGWRLTSNVLFPARFSNDISAVVGLNNVAIAHAMVPVVTHALTHPVTGPMTQRATLVGSVSPAPSACAAASSATRYSGGWTENQIATAYGISPLYGAGDTAKGQTVAVVELEPFLKSDIATFDRCFFGESHANLVHRIPIDGFSFRGAGSGESVLDIESLSALAPAATLDVYEAPNTTTGTLDAYNTIVSSDRANLITTSWGECEQLLDATSPGARQVENYIFEEAAAQGQTFIAATGDSGSDDCATTPFTSNRPVAPYLSVDDPASQPYVLGVGGTSLRSDVQPLGPTSEIAWNDGSQGGAGGGGISDNWSSPSWQSASGVPGVSALLGRQLPDVSASADSVLGMAVYSKSFGRGGWTTIGGTSAAAPIWAAVLAEIAASGATGTACTALGVTPGGADLGFVSPLLYAAAASSYSSDFHAVSLGTNDAFQLGLGYRAGPGFNLVGGLGSPIVTNPDGQPGLASALCEQAAQVPQVAIARPDPLGLSPANGPLSGGTTVTITLSQPLASGAIATVTFGGEPARVVSESNTTISVLTPPASTTPSAASLTSAGPAAVSVTQSTGAGAATSIASPTMVYEYVAESGGALVPSVSGVTPSAGNRAGGNTISIYGSGFSTDTPTVTIGGQPALFARVISDNLLSVGVPPEIGATACAEGAGFSPPTVCQSQVVVANANGSSTSATILPVLTGAVSYSQLGVINSSASVEISPVATEYDYAPTPSISAIRPNPVSPNGHTLVRIIGRGFNLNTLDWVNFGPPDEVNSQQIKFSLVTDHEIDLEVPKGVRMAGKMLRDGVTVQSAAGLSKPKGFSFLGVPSVTNISPRVGPVRGGGRITVSGTNLLGVTSVRFVSAMQSGPSITVAGRSLRLIRNSSLSVRVPRGAPGPYVVEPCNAIWCAPVTISSLAYIYLSPDAPSISRATFSPMIGSASSTVVLFGSNLAGSSAVLIGAYRATQFVSIGTVALGDPNVLIVVVPRGVAIDGARVVVLTPNGRSSPGVLLH